MNDPRTGNARTDEAPDDETMERELAELTGHLDAAVHRQITLIRRIDESGLWARQGAKTCAHWLSWRVKMDLGTAREKLRVGHALAKLPKIDEAFRTAKLSYSQVRAMTRVAVASNEERLLELAARSTASQLERICRGVRQVMRNEGEAPDGDDLLERWVRLRPMGDGTARIEMQLGADEAHRAMDELRKVQKRMEGGEAKPSLADAVVRLFELFSVSSGAAQAGAKTRSEPNGGVSTEAGARSTDADASAEAGAGSTDAGPSAEAGARSTDADASAEAGARSTDADVSAEEGGRSADADVSAGMRGTSAGSALSAEAGRQPAGSGVSAEAGGQPTRSDGSAETGRLPASADVSAEAGGQPTSSNVSAEAGGEPTAESSAEGSAATSPPRRNGRPNGGALSTLVLHLSPEVLGDGHVVTLDDGTCLHPETFRRLACDCGLVPVPTDADGQPLDVGRKTRSIPPALRRALAVRDQGCCTFPGCTHTLYLHAHHVEHWLHGGETKKDNLVSLCSFHHRLVHEGGWAVSFDGAMARFVRPGGARHPHTFPRKGIALDEALPKIRAGHEEVPIDEHTVLSGWGGETPDMDMCVRAALPREVLDGPATDWLREQYPS